MTIYLPRSAWTSTPKPAGLAAMPRSPKGVAVHWPGSKYRIGAASQKNIANRLEGYRRFHVSSRGWTDIAYQAAGDQAGRVWDLRGIEHESAANGDQSVNRSWGAFLFVIGQGEQPSSALLAAFNDWRETRWLKRFPRAGQVVGHRDIRPGGGTDCPGPATEALIKSGAILEDDMPLTADDINAVAHQVLYADVIPSPMFGKSNPTSSPITALRYAMDWSLAGRNAAEAAARDSAAALAIVKAMAAKGGEPLTAAEIEAAAKAGAKAALDERINSATVELNVTQEEGS